MLVWIVVRMRVGVVQQPQVKSQHPDTDERLVMEELMKEKRMRRGIVRLSLQRAEGDVDVVTAR